MYLSIKQTRCHSHNEIMAVFEGLGLPQNEKPYKRSSVGDKFLLFLEWKLHYNKSTLRVKYSANKQAKQHSKSDK